MPNIDLTIIRNLTQSRSVKIRNYTGQTFGNLLVLGYLGSRQDFTSTTQWRTYWLCRCSCGAFTIRLRDNLKRGGSCGCTRNRGLSHLLAYKSWDAMIARCHNARHPAYTHYGAKGITTCERWLVFQNFLEDMGDRPSKQHSLDRYPNKGGNYEPGNCRWATWTEQNRNRRDNRLLTYNGETLPMAAWAERLGTVTGSIFTRLRNGWSDADAVSVPIRSHKVYKQRSNPISGTVIKRTGPD
jgi:hypothetical protein